MRDRFLSHVAKTDKCWLWTGYIKPTGYAQFHVGTRKENIHRVAYELFIGPIPHGLEVDHLCGVKHCVNPEHLEAVTRTENMHRKALTAHGTADHEFTPYFWKQGRVCRICRIRSKARRRLARAVA